MAKRRKNRDLVLLEDARIVRKEWRYLRSRKRVRPVRVLEEKI